MIFQFIKFNLFNHIIIYNNLIMKKLKIFFCKDLYLDKTILNVFMNKFYY